MLDFGYFFRSLPLIVGYGGKEEKGNLFDEYIVEGRCWPNDLDFNWHMNNARYLRECDFGRFKFLFKTGLWNVVRERRKNGMKDCNMLVSAFQLQYRQSVELGDKFKIVTRLIGWDDKAFYLEQFLILDKNKQIAFSLLARFAITPRDLTPQMLVDDLNTGSIQSPIFPPHVENFRQNYKLNVQPIKSKI